MPKKLKKIAFSFDLVLKIFRFMYNLIQEQSEYKNEFSTVLIDAINIKYLLLFLLLLY